MFILCWNYVGTEDPWDLKRTFSFHLPLVLFDLQCFSGSERAAGGPRQHQEEERKAADGGGPNQLS